jgi:cob(I)alamin adenosyltransferase
MKKTGKKGLLMVFTGNGKGKTTAALGLAFRALGHGRRVAMIQFIKGSRHSGELETARCFPGRLDFHVMGRGFTWKSDNLEKDIAKAREAWKFACDIFRQNQHQLVILDELTYLVTYNMISEEDLLAGLASRPKGMHVVVTGRDASPGLLEAADLITEMREIKHPYSKGVKARKGIEY